MKNTNNPTLSKIFSMLTMLTLVFSTMVAFPVSAGANREEEHENNNGSIRICKIVQDSQGNVVAGNSGTTFTVPFVNATYEDPATAVPSSAVFTTPLTLQTVFGDVQGQCVTKSDLAFGRYYYGEEQITSGSEWETPLYDDQVNGQASSLSDLKPFNAGLDPTNDNFDGVINIDANNPSRTLIVLNKMKAPVCTATNVEQAIVSDTATNVNGNPSVATWVHPNWTTVPDATWIWDTAEITNPEVEQTNIFTKNFTVSGAVLSGGIDIAADNGFKLEVNGTTVTDGDKLAVEDNFTASTHYDVASLLHSGQNTIKITVVNLARPGWTSHDNPAGLAYRLTVNENDCVTPPPPVTTATVVATKVVCPTEDLLPNWGNSADGVKIDANTVSDFLRNNSSCHQEPWTFEWAPSTAANPGDGVGAAGSLWTPFAAGTVTIPAPSNPSYVWIREQMKSDYIPFSGATTNLNDTASKNSAEIYCNTDVLNYDNYDRVDDMVAGQTYYCVAFNAPKTPPCDPTKELIQNGSFEEPLVAPSTYSIIPDSDPLLKWLVAWVNPQVNGILGLEIQNHIAGDPAAGSGDQFAELDGDHPVTISQDVSTVPGTTYALSFKYSARPGRDAADNTIEVKADGNVLGAVLADDGTSNTNTVWGAQSRNFVADGDGTTKIEFKDTGTDTSYGGYIDSVSLRCVPPTPPVIPSCDDGSSLVGDVCVPNPADVCPNIGGVQTTVPSGMYKNGDGWCVQNEATHPEEGQQPSNNNSGGGSSGGGGGGGGGGGHRHVWGEVLGASTSIYGDSTSGTDLQQRLLAMMMQLLDLLQKYQALQ